MLTIKKITDRKTTNTDVVIRISFREALRLNTLLNELATNDALTHFANDTAAFGERLRDNLDKLLND
jgi:hypothetical protein